MSLCPALLADYIAPLILGCGETRPRLLGTLPKGLRRLAQASQAPSFLHTEKIPRKAIEVRENKKNKTYRNGFTDYRGTF